MISNEDLLVGLGPNRECYVLHTWRKLRCLGGIQGHAERMDRDNLHAAGQARGFVGTGYQEIALLATAGNRGASRGPDPEQPGDALPVPGNMDAHGVSGFQIELACKRVGDFRCSICNRRSR